MKYKYLFFIALIYNINAIAQLGFNFDSATPNTADMMRYGNTPIKKVNGEISVSIPLYNIDTRNFKMPISLGYSNPGLIPSKQSGPVGYSWFLNAGGVIHRKVEGIPDESFDNDTGDINDKVKGKWHGFIYGEENTTAFERVSNDDIEDFNSHKVDARSNMLSMTTSAPDLSNSKGVYETSPDKFSFNFGGYSGSFFMTYNKEIKVITDTPNKFRVDLSELSYYNNSRNTLNSVKFTSVQNSKIKIHTDNGYTYEFGGDLTSLQFSFSVANLSPGKSDNRDHISLNPAINSWYLTKIIAPDGEEMNISYKSGISNKITNDLSDFTDTPNNPPPVVMSTSQSQYVDPWLINSLYNQGNPAGYLGGSGRNSTSNVSLNYSMSNACYVEKIEIPHKLRLDFNYSLKSRKFYNNLPTGTSFIANKVNVKGYQLDHINITSTNTSERLINSFDFEYTYGNNSSNRRLFLKAIKELGNTPNNLSGVKSHEFKYNSYLFPDPLTLGVDHWGFYNGKNTNSNNPNSSEPGDTPFIPNPEYKPNSFQVIGFVEDSRDPSELSINCMLSRITYPTGGYSNFEYENHTCGKRIEFNPKFSLNDDFEVPQKVGGARIKRIVDFDGNQQTQERTFYYNSSGVLSQWPRYNIPTSKNDPIYYPIYSSTYNTKVAFGSHMAYERVREKYANGSYTDSYFTTQSNGRYDESVTVNNFDLKNPPIITIGDLITADGNITNPNVAPLRYGGYDDILNNSEGAFLGENNISDLSIERGKLLREEYYDSLGSLKRKVENVYKYDNLLKPEYEYLELNDAIPFRRYHAKRGISIYKSIRFVVNCYYDSNFLVETREINYEKGNKGLRRVITHYDYHPNYNKLLETRAEDSYLKQEIVTTNRYPFSENLSLEAELIYPPQTKQSLLAHDLLPIIESKTTLRRLGSIDDSVFPPVAEILREEKLTGNLNKFTNQSKQLQLLKTYSKKGDTGYVKEIEYRNYKGNIPYESISRSGLITTYIWGYGGEYPLAKITNASLATVALALGLSVEQLQDNSAINTSILESKLQNIRELQSLSGALITTYSFLPEIGLTRITDSRGYTTSYTYDTHNRLSKVFDNEGNTSSENLYQYNN